MSRPFSPRTFASSASFVRVNGKIRAREVRVIGIDGKQMGILSLVDALNLARANGVLYTSIPDHVWAVDARTGRELWHATWPSKGGWHIGNRGVAVLGRTVYVETPDCNLVALDTRDGNAEIYVARLDRSLLCSGSTRSWRSRCEANCLQSCGDRFHRGHVGSW